MTDKLIHDLVDLGHQIKQHRKRLGMPVSDLCKQAGISRDTLNRLEKGREVTTHTLLQVLGALHLYIHLNHPSLPALEEAPGFFLEGLGANPK